MSRFVVAAAIVLLSLPTLARADRAAANQCAASLPSAGKAIFDKSLPDVLAGKKIVDAVTASARSMVMGGVLQRAEARPAAEAAGSCLKLVK
jgi:hypothetical protein